MARTSNKTAPEVDETAKVENIETVEAQEMETAKEKKSSNEKEIPADVLALMKLYPHYKEFYVTKNGFVHPAGVPEYLCNGATLYTNKFFNK